jgi:hypothetical protein
MEAKCSSETFADCQQVTLCYSPEDGPLSNHQRVDLRSCNHNTFHNFTARMFKINYFQRPQESLDLLVTEELYSALSTCHCISFYTICWMYLYRLQIKWDYQKSILLHYLRLVLPSDLFSSRFSTTYFPNLCHSCYPIRFSSCYHLDSNIC